MDSVCMQVVVRHLLRHSADVFSLEKVLGLWKDELYYIGGERE